MVTVCPHIEIKDIISCQDGCNIKEPKRRKKDNGTKSRLSDEREELLNGINFVWSRQDHIWNTRLDQLKQFKIEHGHTRVPTKGGKLGNWVMLQRLQYSLQVKGEKNTLTDQRIKALNEIGFVWHMQEVSWEEKYNELRSCLQKHSEMSSEESISSYITRNAPHLHSWIASQRAEKRYKEQGLHNHLGDERENRLNNINFDWYANLDRKKTRALIWMKNFEQLKQYIKQNGTSRVPYRADQSLEEKSFSIWVRDQRRYFKADQRNRSSPMTQERRDLLESIGFANEM
mmetsp:Transcript_25990/g.29715  ORF Transcript_25990/g.29715 Transcript_25990/m.29715 type:complete len:287 (-) Transcript_25990:276-1136(-)